MKLRKILMGLAAVVGFTTAATAATPVAVWDGDFTTATKSGWTIAENGNTKTDTSITIVAGKKGVLVTPSAAKATQTVIVRYSDLARPEANNGYVLGTVAKWNVTDANQDYVGTASVGTDGKAYGLFQTKYWHNSNTVQTQAVVPQSGKFGLSYDRAVKTQLMGSSGLYYSATGLKSSNDGSATFAGFTIGGMRYTVTTTNSGYTYSPAAGMVITGIAVFESTLTQDEVAAYKFPSEKPTYESVVSMNFGADSYNVPADTDPGACVDDSNWYNLNGNDITDAEAGSLLVSYGGSGTYQKTDRIPVYLKGYIDDNGKTVNITVKNLKTASYDVYIYCNSDNASGWNYKTVNGKDYTADATGTGVSGTGTWGNNSNLSEVLGKNVMVVKNVYPDADGTIAISSPRSGNYRGCIAAIQICENPAAPTYTASIDQDANWEDLEWNPSKPAGGFEDNAVLKLTVAGNPTLTFNEILNAPQRLEISNDDDTSLTLKAADKLFTDGCYEKTIATFGTFVPGCATVSATLPAGFSGAYTLTDSGFKVRAQNREVISINVAGGKITSTQQSSYPPEPSPKENMVTNDAIYYGVAPTLGSTWNNIDGQWKNYRTTVTLEGSIASAPDGTIVERPTIDLSATAGTTWQADITNPFLRGYLDDGGGVQVAVHGIPYTKYDVIVYVTSDSAGIRLAPVTINGTTWTYVDGELVKGNTAWGKALCNVPAIGDNAIYIKDCEGEQLTIDAQRVNQGKAGDGRGTVCAVQVINQGEILIRSEYYGEMDGDVVWTDGKTAGNLKQLGADWVNGQLSTITITNTVEGANFSFGAETIGQQIKFVSDYPITIDATTLSLGKLGVYDFTEVEGGVIFQLPEEGAFDPSALPTTIKGDWKFSKTGTIVFDGNFPTAEEQTFFKSVDDWAGTVWLKNVALAGTSLDNFCNENSILKFTGVTGWLRHNSAVQGVATLELEDDGDTLAFEVTDSSDSKVYNFAKFIGDGTFRFATKAASGCVMTITDVSEFTGKLLSTNGDGTTARPIFVGTDKGTVSTNSCITVADGATINTGCGWEAASAAFGATINAPECEAGQTIISGLKMQTPVYLATKVAIQDDFHALRYYGDDNSGKIDIEIAESFEIKDCLNATFAVEGAFEEGGYWYAADGAPLKVTYTTVDGFLFSDGSTTKVIETTVEGGMEPIEAGDEPVKAAAKIGTTYYLTLAAALDAAQADDTVTLLKDITTAETAAFTIDKSITLDFATFTVEKTVANDYTFDVTTNVTVTFTGTTGGVKQTQTAKNPNYPASMIRNKGDLTIEGGVYTSDFCIIKNDEDPGAGTLTVNGGTFNIVEPVQGFKDIQMALMNWSTATINGGTWNGGTICTRSCDGNKVSKAGTTEITTTLEGTAKCLLLVGYPGDTTYENVPKIKGVDIVDVELKQVSTITDELELVEKDGWITVQKKSGGTEVVPGEPVHCDTLLEAEKATIALDDKQKAMTQEQQDAYTNLFTKVIIGSQKTGYTVSFLPTEDTVTSVSNAVVEADKELLSEITPGETVEVSIETKPGLYYSVAVSETLSTTALEKGEGDRTMGTGEPLELEVTTPEEATKCFYQIMVNVSDTKVGETK